MLTEEQNELLTRTGPGTPGGELLRRFWQPAALTEELPPGGAPLPIRLLGEDLVLFRTPSPSPLPQGGAEKGEGGIGLLGLHCSHRGADLSYGRLEDGGLRCIYHGWLYDIHGRCLEQPGEPALSNADFGLRSAESAPAQSAIRNRHSAIKHTAYPCREFGGMIFAYLGPGEPPLLPAYEFLLAPDEYRLNGKGFHDCNYLQGNEGNIDPAHLSFLHRWLNTDEARTPRARGDGTSLYGRDLAPTIEIEPTEFGVRIFSVRNSAATQRYMRISNFIFPNLSAFPGGQSRDGYSVNWHVPIDDTHHWKYTVTFSRGDSIDPTRWGRDRSEFTPDYHLVRNRANRYLQDREEMSTRTFAGIGSNFMAQDACVTEGAGPIADRTQEHLSSTDKAIVAARFQLLKAIQDVRDGRDPMHLIRDPDANSFPFLGAVDPTIAADFDWRSDWKEYFPGGTLGSPRAWALTAP